MTETLQAPLREMSDIKIFILYLMKNIGYPLDFNTISDMAVQDEFVNYFDFAECFAELLDAGHVIEESNGGSPTYVVSEMGRRVAEELKTSIRGIIREKSLRSALRMLSFKRRGAKLRSETEIRADGRYNYNCAIVAKSGDVMNIELVLDSKQLCEKMDINFRDKPDIVYRGLIALLSGDVNYLID